MTKQNECELVIELKNVCFSYDHGETWALDDISLEVRAGECVALVGPNGSGKSTLSRVMAGLNAPDSGTVRLMNTTVFDNVSGAHADRYRQARRSIGAVFQNPEDQIVTTVVADDVAFGPENLNTAPALITDRVHQSLQAVNMLHERDADPTALSGGQQQRVAIADMLAMDSQVLVLDEPTAMLDPHAREDVLAIVDAIHKQGTTIVMVTHHPDELQYADRIIHIDEGHITRIDKPSVSSHHRQLSQEKQQLPDLPQLSPYATDPVITLEHVTFQYGKETAPVLQDINLSIERGSTVALIGPNGSGKTTFAKLVCALLAPTRGSITVDGIALRRAKRRQRKALRRSLGLIMQRPERQLFAPTVREDVAFGPRNLGIDPATVDTYVDQALQMLGIEELADRNPYSLSGGQQRLVAIAGVLACHPSVLIMDEPTASLDDQATLRIHELIHTLHNQGVTIVLITHDMASAQTLADSMIVFGQEEPQQLEHESQPITTSDSQFSWISSLDPRAKIIGFLVLMFSAFALNSWIQLALGVCATAILAILSRLGWARLRHSVRTFMALFIVIGLLNIFVVHTGTPLVHIGSWALTTGGIATAVLYTIRFSLVIILGVIVIRTTTPTALTDAFESLLSPWKHLIHVQEIALVLSLALRFLPTLTTETIAIRDAQAARGGSIETGSLLQRIRAMCAIIVPIFAGVIRHADNLALALDARCYQEGAPRSHWHKLSMKSRDWSFLGAVAIFIALLVLTTVFSM